MPELDPSFLALPARELAAAALARAQELGCEHADFRLERICRGVTRLRDASIEASSEQDEIGIAVRVVHRGAWGFAGSTGHDVDTAVGLAEQAVATARLTRPLLIAPVELAPEQVHRDVCWVSSYMLDPFEVPRDEQTARLVHLSARLLAAEGVDHVETTLDSVRENKFYADTAGTITTQQRVRVAGTPTGSWRCPRLHRRPAEAGSI
jgi:TldD protein